MRLSPLRSPFRGRRGAPPPFPLRPPVLRGPTVPGPVLAEVEPVLPDFDILHDHTCAKHTYHKAMTLVKKQGKASGAMAIHQGMLPDPKIPPPSGDG